MTDHWQLLWLFIQPAKLNSCGMISLSAGCSSSSSSNVCSFLHEPNFSSHLHPHTKSEREKGYRRQNERNCVQYELCCSRFHWPERSEGRLRRVAAQRKKKTRKNYIYIYVFLLSSCLASRRHNLTSGENAFNRCLLSSECSLHRFIMLLEWNAVQETEKWVSNILLHVSKKNIHIYEYTYR